MKKIFILLIFAFSFIAQQSWAQPTFSFLPQQTQVNPGDQVCLDLDLVDFTDILSVQFSIQWDPGVIDFQNVTGLNPSITGLDMGDFDLSQVDNGILTFNWSNGQPCNTATSGVTLPDGADFFKLCFTATGVYGNHTFVQIVDQPVDRIVRRLAANCIDIGEFEVPGFISLGTKPLTINISSADGFKDDIVCVDFKVKDFKNLISFQYFIFWDTSVLQFENVTTMNLPGNYFTGQNLVGSGMLSTIWYTNNINQGVTLPDGTQIMQICFKIKGNCGQSSPIYIGQNIFSTPNEPIEVIDVVTSSSPMGVNIGLLQQQGTVTVNCFNPNGINVTVDDKNVCPGETFTVDVKVSNFSDIVKLQFNLKWNPDIIEMISPKVTFPQSGGCFNFNNPTTVNSNSSPQGLVSVDWTATGFGCDLPDNFILMRLHFKAKGASGSNSTIAVVNPILVDKFGGQVVNIGINNNNGLVTICELTSPTVVAASMNANPGETVCIDFTVQDFEDITRMQYTINWEPNVLQYVGVQGFNLSGLSSANFLTTQVLSLGVLGVEWENSSGISVPDGTAIFKVCFKVIGNPGDCSHISFDDVPWPIDVKTTSSNNTNVGLNGQQGQICTLNPLSFQVSVPDVISGQFSDVCLDVTAKNFLQLTEMTYSFNWNPTILQYVGIQTTGNLPGFGPTSYDDDPSLTLDGQLVINWLSPNQIIGTTVADGQSLFKICFKVIGSPSSCSPVTVTGFPTPIMIKTAPTGDANLGLTAKQGSVCVSGTINVANVVITNLDCPSIPTGAIDLSIAGGSGNFTYSWVGANVNSTSQDQSGLFQGTYKVTVTDSQNPALVLNLEYVVGLAPGAPVANAGVDTSFTCGGGFFMTLNGSGSSGDNITYLWKALNIGGIQGIILPGEEANVNPKIVGGKFYELTVTNPLTGCVDKDTVKIDAPVKPTPEAGEMTELLTCANDTLILDGTASPFGYDVLWSTVNGNIVPGTETFLTPQVTAPGLYYLTLNNPQTNCNGIDSVMVEAFFDYPNSDAGVDATLGCLDQAVFIGGTNSSAGPEFTYLWSTPNGEVCGNSNSGQTSVCSPGTYFLTVTNVLNGCTTVDTILVESDTLKPIAHAGPDFTLTCVLDEVTLDGSGSSSSGNYSYTWTTLNGGNIVMGENTLNPVVNAPGLYQLMVLNNDNNCTAISEVEVDADIDLPTVAGTASNKITCLLNSATLNATGSSSGNEFTYIWKNSTGDIIGTGLTIQVSSPDIYTLLVTNSLNLCKDSLEIMLEGDTTPPVANAGTDNWITCINSAPQLLGTAESNPNLIIQWSGPAGNCIQNGNSLTPTVTCPGNYILTVADTVTGCLRKDTVSVLMNTTLPAADAGPDTILTCFVDQIVLPGSSDQPDILVSWSSIPAGLPILDPSSLNPTITSPGSYTLTVTNNANGCSKSDIVVVGANKTPPIANAGADGEVDCLKNTDMLSASNSDLVNTTVTWTQIGGAFSSNNVEIEVGAGLYELLVINNQNGCESRDTAEVVNEAILPDAVAGDVVEIGCEDQFATLDALGSASGPNILYTWADEFGAIIGSEQKVTVSSPGIYTLTVFDSENNCENMDSVEVIQSNSGEPASALADHDPCSAEAILLGNLPNGATGVWSSLSGATIDDPNAATASATRLIEGENIFVWTLSLGNCLNYSSDTVRVDVSHAAPNAVGDQVTLTPDLGNSVSLNALGNDLFEDVNFKLLISGNIIGAASATEDGTITYVKEKCFVGNVRIDYEICEKSCPELCDTATLVVNVLKNEVENCDEVPNGITPNGDGVNDQLVFDILLSNPPDAFPDNEIIIFNRWGDVVYQAKPYLNDWAGHNKGGHLLPHGTYYYILRLNIGNGDILKGDVTILK